MNALLTDRRHLHLPRFSGIWVATALLFAVSPFLASGSVSHSALLSMLPFAAILAIARIGQTLVIQQRGLDLSVPGMITLTTILITKVPDGDPSLMPKAIGLILVACTVAGLVSGLAITVLAITPLVATLGVNAILQGGRLRDHERQLHRVGLDLEELVPAGDVVADLLRPAKNRAFLHLVGQPRHHDLYCQTRSASHARCSPTNRTPFG